MKFFKNMKITKKLILSFLVITAFSILLAGVGIFSASSINGNYMYLINEPILREVYLRGIETDFMTMRYRTANFVMNSGDAEFVNSTLLPQYQKAYESLQELLAAYIQNNADDTRTDPETLRTGGEKAKRLNELMGQYHQIAERVLATSIAGDAGAADAMLKDAIPMTNEINTLLDELIDPVSDFVDETAENIARSANILTAVQIAATVACIALALTLAFYISRIIGKPLVLMSQFLNRFSSEGDLGMTDEDTEYYQKRSKDEIGACQEALGSVIFRLQSVNETLSKVAGGDLTASVEVLSQKDSLGLAVNQMATSLNEMFSEISGASSQVSAGAVQVSQAAQELASGSSQQAASIEEFSATLSELREKTNRNADNSIKARVANEKAATQLQHSVRSMEDMLTAMKGIDESSGNISRVIKVIDDIAFQTNILALNAAVEAARAGQHGKGFAVVADEVRNLASKSAAAAKETATLIDGSTERVREGNQIVAKTNESLETVIEYAQELARLVGGVVDASNEQAKSIEEINQGIEQISSVVQANSATAEESAAAAEEMSAQSVMLGEIVARFKLAQESEKTIGYSGTEKSGGNYANKATGQSGISGFALSDGKY